MRRAALVALIAVLAAGWTHGSVLQNVGKAQINIAEADFNAQLLMNAFASSNFAFGNNAQAAAVDMDGYPVRNFSGSISYAQEGALWPGATYRIQWPAGRACFKINFSTAANASNATNVTVTNGGGSGNLSITGDCANPGHVDVVWTTNSYGTLSFDGTYSSWASNTTGVISMVRSTDLAAFNSGTYWTPEFVALLKRGTGLAPRAYRPMAWQLPLFSGANSNESMWAYRSTPTNFQWTGGAGIMPTAWAGGVGAAGTITVTTGAFVAAAAADTNAGGWVAGEVIQGIPSASSAHMVPTGTASNGGNVQITVADTTGLVPGNPVYPYGIGGTTEANQRTTILSVDDGTHFTINVPFVNAFVAGGNPLVAWQTMTVTGKSASAVLIVGLIPVATDTGTNISSFIYDGVLNNLLYVGAGVIRPPPIEAQVQLANLVNMNYWWTVQPMVTNNYITNALNLIYANLNSNLKLTVEWANEVWNSTFNAFHFSRERGAVLGITALYAGAATPYQSLQNRIIFGNLIPTSNWSAAMSRIDRFYGIQGGTFGDTGISNQMKGVALVSPGSAAYQSFVGGSGVNYNTKPNRPVDYTESFGYAPYFSGAATSGQSPDVNSAPSAFQASKLQAIADDTVTGNTAAASALIDADVRTGTNSNQQWTITASGTTITTSSNHTLVNGNGVAFTVSGGTAYSGITTTELYTVDTVTSNTLTVKAIINGVTQGSDVNFGSAGTGTTSIQRSSQGLFNLQSQWFTQWESMAASFDSDRANGLGPLQVEWYEGAPEPSAPTPAQSAGLSLTESSASMIGNTTSGSQTVSSMDFTTGVTVGMTVTDSAGNIPGGTTVSSINASTNAMQISQAATGTTVGNTLTLSGGTGAQLATIAIAQAIVNWKNSGLASQLLQDYYNSFLGNVTGYITTNAMPHSVAPSQLVLFGGGYYGLIALPNTLVAPNTYQLFNGFQAFSSQ